MIVVVAAAGAALAVVMMMLVGGLSVGAEDGAGGGVDAGGAGGLVIVVVVAQLAVLIVVMMLVLMLMVVVMVVIVAAAVAVLIVVMMLVLMLVVVVMVVIVTAAVAVLVMVMMVVVLHLMHQLLGQRVTAGHGGDDLLAGELIPGGGEDGGLLVLLAQQLDGAVQLLLVAALGAGEDDGAGVLHLVVEELTEVLHIDLGLGGIDHGDEAVQLQLHLVLDALHGGDDVGELANAGGLDDDAVRGVIGQHLLQSGAEVAHQRAADAAGVHLGDFHAGVLQETAVDADLAELVLDENQLLALIGLIQQFLDEGGLAGAQKAGDNIDLGHGISKSFLRIIYSTKYADFPTWYTKVRQHHRG